MKTVVASPNPIFMTRADVTVNVQNLNNEGYFQIQPYASSTTSVPVFRMQFRYELANSEMSGWITHTRPLGCRVYRATSQTIPDGAVTALAFDTEVYDQGDCWSSAQPTRLVVPVRGLYLAGGGWARDAANNPNSSRHWVMIGHNGTTSLAANEEHTVPNKAVIASACAIFWGEAGDYVEIMALQDSGAPRNSFAAGATNQARCWGALVRLA